MSRYIATILAISLAFVTLNVALSSGELSAAPTSPLCCRYAGPAVLVKDCPKHFTCSGPPALPVITDIRCDHRKCPAAVNVNRGCINKDNELVKGPHCTYQVATPSCDRCGSGT